MSETQNLIVRIEALAAKIERAPSTVSAQLLGSGKSLSDLKSGKTITLAKYERAMRALDELEGPVPEGQA
jgi:hypothetical protein